MKKTMKLLALATAILLLCAALTACGQPTTYEIVNEAIANTTALDSMHATMKMNMDMELGGLGTSVNVPITADIKATGLQGESPVILSDVTVSVMGMGVTTSTYTEGEYLYMSVMDEKYKVKIAEMDDYDGMSDVNNMLKSLPEELLAEVVATENANGTKTVKVSVPQDMLQTLYADLITQVQESAAEGATVSDCAISDAEVEITVSEDGYVAEYNMEFDMEMTMSMAGLEVTVSAEVEAEIEIENPGEPVTVTPPEGYQDYPEVDADEVGI